MKLTIALLTTLLLAGCLGTEKAPKDCGEFAHKDVCDRKDHCAWSGTACVAK